MITIDPARRTAILAEVERLIGSQAPASERERLLTFARVAFAEMPDQMAFHLHLPEVAARLVEFYDFVVRQMPPEHQLYRGLPGIHVVARNPDPG